MKTTLGKDLQPGDRVIHVDGQAMRIVRITRGMARNSRIAEFTETDEHGRLWASIFDGMRYELPEEENGGTK